MTDYTKKPDEMLKQMIKDIEMDIMKTHGNLEITGIKKENRKKMRREKARILTELNKRK